MPSSCFGVAINSLVALVLVTSRWRSHGYWFDPQQQLVARRTLLADLSARYAALVLGLPSAHERDLRDIKEELFADLPRHAAIVELGPGPGTNAEWLRAAAPRRYVAVEKNPYFAARTTLHLDAGEEFVSLASLADVPTASADVVVATLVLCSIDDAADTLREIRRVLVPTAGRYYFLEHVAAASDGDETTPRWYARGQRLVRPLQRTLADGCDPDKPTEALVRDVFDLVRLRRVFLPGHFPIGPTIAGVAVAPPPGPQRGVLGRYP